MGVSRDHDPHARRLGSGSVTVIKVEPPGIGVDFQEGSGPSGGSDHCLDVDIVGRPTIDQPPCGVADDSHVWILDGFDNPGRDPFAGLILAVVEAGHHPISPSEDLIG